jgi:hypothetical protein
MSDGAILIVQSENAAAILCDSRPVAVTDERGEFDSLPEGETWRTFEGGRYRALAALAWQLSRVLETGRRERGMA